MGWPTYDPIRVIAATPSRGPTSLMIIWRIGDCGWPASAIPIRPPIDVPTQSTLSTSSRAINVTMSETYCGTA